MLILIYNRMFRQETQLDHLNIPSDVEFTEDRQRMSEADAVVFHLPSLHPLFLRRKHAGQTWVAWSMECEQHYRRLRDDRFMSRFDLRMTYQRNADIMVSYIPAVFRNPPLEPLPPVSHQGLACSVISGRVDRSGREKYIRELAEHMEVHQYGRRGDRAIPNDRGHFSKIELCSRYKFTLAFENAIETDYVTEKFYEPLLAGSVPVYLGAPNIGQFAPAEACYINALDYSGPAELAAYLQELGRDDQSYSRFLNWRKKPYQPSFLDLLQKTSRPCWETLCEVLAERMASKVEIDPG